MIHKQLLSQTFTQTLSVPLETKFLSAQVQGQDKVAIWYWFPDRYQENLQTREVLIVATGQNHFDLNDTWQFDQHDFLGTIQLGEFVFHIFVQKPQGE